MTTRREFLAALLIAPVATALSRDVEGDVPEDGGFLVPREFTDEVELMRWPDGLVWPGGIEPELPPLEEGQHRTLVLDFVGASDRVLGSWTEIVG